MKFLESLTLVLGRFPKVRTGRPDQTFWQRNRIFSRGFAEKPSPLCIIFRIWLIWMVSFNQKWNSYYDGNGLAGQFWQMESALSQSNLFKYNKQVKNNYFHLPSEEHGTKDIIPHPGLWHTVFVLQWLGNRNCDKFLKYPRITKTIGGHIVHNFVNTNGLLLKFKTEQKYTTINLRGICYISINFSLLK